MAGGRKTHKSMYKPKHPEKYAGDHTNIVCRSSWERTFAKYCDLNTSIIKWASETVVVPYFDRGSGKQRRYFPDFLIQIRQTDGSIKTIMVEIKPYAESVPPVPPKKKTKKTEMRLMEATQTYATNQSKWEAAREYCRKRGYSFVVITERELFAPKK